MKETDKHSKRSKLMWLFVIFCLVLIAGIWLVTLKYNLAGGFSPFDAKKNQEKKGTLEEISTFFKEIKRSVPNGIN